MTYTILSVFNILVAAAMIVLIMMQRGAGADAGASFGGGSSGTVFGARGSATFLSRATGVLAAVFMIISLAMGMLLEQNINNQPAEDLGVMAGLVQQQDEAAASPATSVVVPASPAAVMSTDAGEPVAADAVPGSDAVASPVPATNEDAAATDDSSVPQPAAGGSAG